MTHSAEHYRDQMLAAQPPGIALPTDPDSTWAKLFHALGEEFARIEHRGEDLLTEADPAQADELLPDWERNFDLPDPCTPAAQTLEQRQGALLARMTWPGGQSVQYFTNVAERLGYTITITEYQPHTVDSPVDHPLYDEWWSVAVKIETGASEQDSKALECVIERLKHVQIITIYEYT